MRPEVKEYKFDTLLWHVLDVGHKTLDSTEKEIRWLGDYVPYYDRIIDTWAREGRVGKLFLEMVWQYMDNIKTAQAPTTERTTRGLSPSLRPRPAKSWTWTSSGRLSPSMRGRMS